MSIKQTKQLVKSFCLFGKITQKHAEEIENLIEKFLTKNPDVAMVCSFEAGQRSKEIEIEKQITELQKEYANPPLDKRGCGNDWLRKVKEKLKIS